MSDPNAFQPVLVLGQDGPALWRLTEPIANTEQPNDAGQGVPTTIRGSRLALALFSDPQRATDFAKAEYKHSTWRVESPDPQQTVRVLAACFRQGVDVAVLNPSGNQAGRAFDLREMLGRVREQLRKGQPLQF